MKPLSVVERYRFMEAIKQLEEFIEKDFVVSDRLFIDKTIENLVSVNNSKKHEINYD